MSMCYPSNPVESSFIGQLIELSFLTAACVVQYIGLSLAVLTLGLSPLYVFVCYVLRRKSDTTRIRKIIYGTVAFLLTAILSGVFFITEAILNAGI